jgi:ATP-dependent Lon protease
MKDRKFFSIDSMSFQGIDEDADLIPLMTPEDEEEINREPLPGKLPILPLKKYRIISRSCCSNYCW